MHVLLIGNFAPDHQESMLRFSRQLTAGLQAMNHEVSTWAPQPRLVRLLPRYRYGGFAKYVGYLDKFVLFPRQVRTQLAQQRPVDVVHIIDHANAVYAPLFSARPVLATCHDLLQIRAARGEFSQHRVAGLGRRYQEWILSAIARLPHAVTPSAQTARDLHRLAGLPLERTTVVPMGLNYPYRRSPAGAARTVLAPMLQARGLPADLLQRAGGFLLNVGGGQWYKNRSGLLELYAVLRRLLTPVPQLILVGKPLSAEHRGLAHALSIERDVTHLTHVSELELQALYSTAEGLLFPSWHEGFGWPVAEAQACGCAVFTSRRAPMTEVGGAAAAYFDPADVPAAARAIAEAWPQRDALGQKGLARASEWNPGRMIERYVDTYLRLGAAAQPVAA